MSSKALVRRVVWRALFQTGVEFCELYRAGSGWLLAGSVIAVLEGRQPLRVEYSVSCDASWRTRQVRIREKEGARQRSLRLRVDKKQRWWGPRGEIRELRAFMDVDLGITPATNTLPIRRMRLDVGATQEVTAAWVRFPALSIEPLTQRYTRLGDGRYCYESRGGSFSAELTVDELGLVESYSGGWERLAGS